MRKNSQLLNIGCFFNETKWIILLSFTGKAVSHDVLYARNAPNRRELSLQVLNNNHKHGGFSMDPLLTSSPNGTHVGSKIEDYFNHGENSGKTRFFEIFIDMDWCKYCHCVQFWDFLIRWYIMYLAINFMLSKSN